MSPAPARASAWLSMPSQSATSWDRSATCPKHSRLSLVLLLNLLPSPMHAAAWPRLGLRPVSLAVQYVDLTAHARRGGRSEPAVPRPFAVPHTVADLIRMLQGGELDSKLDPQSAFVLPAPPPAPSRRSALQCHCFNASACGPPPSADTSLCPIGCALSSKTVATFSESPPATHVRAPPQRRSMH